MGNIEPAEYHETAAFLACSNFRLFPLKPQDKTPAVKEWQQRAITSAEFFDKNPRLRLPGADTRNIGVATGEGLLVVDVDVKRGKQGLASLSDLAATHGELPETYTVRTPTRGLHLYFRIDRDLIVRNRANVRPGIDIRGDGGYVVAEGSLIPVDGEIRRYTLKDGHPRTIARAPKWLIELCRSREATDGPSLSPDRLDGPSAIRMATQYLSEAEPAVEGDGGDHRTFTVAARLRDFGVSEDIALELMDLHWNDRCEPPWDFGDLRTKVHNAFAYAANPQGADSPESQYDDVVHTPDDVKTSRRYAATAPKPFTRITPVESRPWVLGHIAQRRKVSLLVAPGGVGKSTLSILACLAVATGRQDLMGMEVQPSLAKRFRADNREPTRLDLAAPAWLYNNEDDRDELMRRASAALQLHAVDGQQIEDRLYLNSGDDHPLKLATMVTTKNGDKIAYPDVKAMIAHARERHIALLVVDPFVETHDLNENSNTEMAAVGGAYRRIAQEANCAVLLIHHTRKPAGADSDGHVGNADSGRGASALKDLSRAAFTLYGMSATDAVELGVRESEKHWWVRLDDAKGNMAAPSPGGASAARWFRRESVDVATLDGVTEAVGALRAATDDDLLGYDDVPDPPPDDDDGDGEDAGSDGTPAVPGAKASTPRGGGRPRDRLAVMLSRDAVQLVDKAGGSMTMRELINVLMGEPQYLDFSRDTLRKRLGRLLDDGEDLLRDPDHKQTIITAL